MAAWREGIDEAATGHRQRIKLLIDALRWPLHHQGLTRSSFVSSGTNTLVFRVCLDETQKLFVLESY